MSRVRTTLAVLLALFAILTLLDRFVLVELLVRRIGVPALLALAEGLAIVGVGGVVRRGKHVDPALDYLLGYPVFGTLLYLAGLIRVSAAILVPVLVIGIVLGIWALLKRYGDDAYVKPALPPLTWPAIAVIAVLACGFVTAQAPPSSLDELAYHLAAPQAWVLEGRVVELPLLSHAYFPAGVESADLLPLLLLGANDGGIASHFLHLLAALATTILIARRTSSWLATAAIVTTPALAITAGWSLVDWPLAGAFVALYFALQDDDLNTASAATAAGLLTKYTFLPFALVAWALKRRIPRWSVVLGLVFFVRNVIQTGNPFAPFLGSDAPHVSHYRAVALADYVFEGPFIDEALGATLLILPAFASGLLALASVVLALAFFLLGPSSRLLVPYLVVPAVSAAPELRRRSLAVFVAIGIVIQTFLVVWFTARTESFSLLAGTTEQDYLRNARPSYAAVEWLNQSLPQRSRTLVVGYGETFWFSRPVRGGGNFDSERLSRYLDLPAPEALREQLRKDGITHVAVLTVAPPTTDAKKQEERQTTLSPAAQKMLSQTLDRYASSVTSRGNAALFTLR